MNPFHFDDLYDTEGSTESLVDDSDIFRNIRQSGNKRNSLHKFLLLLAITSSLISSSSIIVNYKTKQLLDAAMRHAEADFDKMTNTSRSLLESFLKNNLTRTKRWIKYKHIFLPCVSNLNFSGKMIGHKKELIFDVNKV